MKNKLLIYFFLLPTTVLFFDKCYSQNLILKTEKVITKKIICSKSNSISESKLDTGNLNRVSLKEGSFDLQPVDDPICGLPNNDDEISFTGFFGLNVSVHSPDNCLDEDPNANAHSDISVFIDPNDKFVIKTSDLGGPTWGGRSGTDWFSSIDRGQTWNWDYLNNSNADFNSYGDPSTVINNNGIWFAGFLGAVQETPPPNSTELTDVRVGAYYNNSWHGPYSVNFLDIDRFGYYYFYKPHLMVDNSTTSPYNGHLYCAYTPINYGGSYPSEWENQIEISKSVNDGVTWDGTFDDHVLTTEIFSPGPTQNLGANIQTGPNGEVYVVWAAYDLSSEKQGDIPGYGVDEKALGFARSIDGGNTYETFNPPYFGKNIQNIFGIGGYGSNNYEWNFDIPLNSYPSMCVDKSDGPYSGSIYVVWAEHAMDTTNTYPIDAIDVYMIYSRTQGVTWGENRIRVNSHSGETYHSLFPWISCDDETGVLSVIFYDDRDLGYPRTGYVNAYVAMSKDYGFHWEDCRVSDYYFRPDVLGTDNPYVFGDHIGIGSKKGLVYPIWTDSRKLQQIGGQYGCKPEAYISPYYAWNCVLDYSNVTELVPSDKIREWEVSHNINARNTINANGLAVYNAGNDITFLPSVDPDDPDAGFTANSGSFVHAYIEGCQSFNLNSSKSIVENSKQQNNFLEKNKYSSYDPNIKIFPNPCNGKFQVELNNINIQDLNLEITNSSGMLVYSSKYSGLSVLNLDISVFPKGVYFIKILTIDNTYINKIIYN